MTKVQNQKLDTTEYKPFFPNQSKWMELENAHLTAIERVRSLKKARAPLSDVSEAVNNYKRTMAELNAESERLLSMKVEPTFSNSTKWLALKKQINQADTDTSAEVKKTPEISEIANQLEAETRRLLNAWQEDVKAQLAKWSPELTKSCANSTTLLIPLVTTSIPTVEKTESKVEPTPKHSETHIPTDLEKITAERDRLRADLLEAQARIAELEEQIQIQETMELGDWTKVEEATQESPRKTFT